MKDIPIFVPHPQSVEVRVDAFEVLTRELARFEKALPPDREMLVLDSTGSLFVRSFRQSGSFIVLEGDDQFGQPAALLVHSSDCRLLLRSVAKNGEKARRIGFRPG